jgi:tetratricopeptide (TPR) repeat protein
MFKVKTIVICICTAFAASGCASFQQFSDKAAQVLGQRATEQTELSADQWYHRGKEYQAQRNYDAAVAAYLEALQRDHALADARNALGVVYAQEGRYEEAIAQFKTAIELKPGEAYLHSNLGYALLLQGLDREALNPLDIALQLEPTNEKAAFNLRLAHERLGDVAPSPVAASDAGHQSDPAVTKPIATGGQETSSDPRLVSVAPSIYELRMPVPSQPQTAAIKNDLIEASPLPPAEQPGDKTRAFKLEISNGNGTAGLAKRVARMLDKNGIHANRVTNHATFHQAKTEIQYRKGYLSEASSLRRIFVAEVKAVPVSTLRKDIQVRVVLGKDVQSVAALRLQTPESVVATQSTEPSSR